ncbi:MAG: UDP-N-acetylmuramoyl-tripeptide--D-alanyl-D-alanine ligase [Chloroflexi bacterium]|nr:UDP-N-acetylmuramoyl-tripeptide--D-alanyl-D-alanine ligase [Chloroflexota bacterium]
MESLRDFARQARRGLAAFWLNTIHARTVQIGITGSYGKTSTTHAIAAVLAAHAPTLTTDVNLDTIYNIPITALRLRNHRYAVFEAGIDRPNEMSFHLEIVQPDISVITGIAPVHADADHLGSVENIIREKRKLIEALQPGQRAILHIDDPNVRDMTSYTQGDVIGYGQSPKADFRAESITVRPTGLAFTAVTPDSTFPIQTPLLGRHNATNIMAAVAIGCSLGVPVETMQAALADLEPLRGRLNIEPGPLGTTLINDALRANTASTRAGLTFLDDLTIEGRRIAVLGEMGEIGETAVEEHAAIGEHIAGLDIDLTVCVGGLTRHIVEGAVARGLPTDRIQFVSDVHQAAEAVANYARAGDILYLKGSLLRHLERVRLILEGWEVGCTVESCPFYHQCTACEYRIPGYIP